MNNKELIQYIKNTERMVSPAKVAQVNQVSNLLGKLPLKWQKGIAAKGAKTNPYMGFVVEPYSFFLSYEITDTEAVEKMLPRDYRLIPASMFRDTPQRPVLIIGAFNVHTSVFWGSRVEVYAIAENIKTGLMSWVILDYESNTNSFDPGQGFIGPTTTRSVVTTSYRGDVIVDVEGENPGKRLSVVASIKEGEERPLSRRLWIEGNLSVDYGGELQDGESEPFGLIFDPGEMDTALEIPLDKVTIEGNTFLGDYAASQPFEAGCFPFAQHFITTSMPVSINMKSEEDLEEATERFAEKVS